MTNKKLDKLEKEYCESIEIKQEDKIIIINTGPQAKPFITKSYKQEKSTSLLNDIETIEEIPLDDGDCRVRDIVNLLIKNDRIHTQILNLLIKKNNGKLF